MTMNKKNSKNKNNNIKNNEQSRGTDSQKQIVQWFPGHMAKTRRLIKESLPFVDLVTEIVDARIPLSSSNPELSEMIGDKPRIVLLNKCDVADENALGKYKVSSDDGANVRSDAGSDYDLLGELSEGDIVEGYAIKSAENGKKWLCIKYNGEYGWVSMNMLEPDGI